MPKRWGARGLRSRVCDRGGLERAGITRRQAVAVGAACACACVATCASALPFASSRAFAAPSDDKLAEARAALAELDELQVKLDAAAADYGEAQMALIGAEEALATAAAKVAATQERISEVQLRLGQRARSMYRTGSASLIDMLLGATSFKQLVTNWEILSDLNDSDAELVRETKELKVQLAEEEKACEVQRNLAQEAESAAAQAAADAQLMVDEMSATYDRLNSEAQELLAQEEAAREEQLRQEAIAAAAASSASGDSASSSSSGSPSSGSSSGSSSSSGSTSDGPPRPNTNINNDKAQSVQAELVLARAQGEIGKPYVWGACGPDSFDCSGLVSYCLCGTYGVRLGTTYTFYYWTRVTDPKPGDICVSWTHCGIYIGGGQMIHAPNKRKPVQVGSVQSSMIYVRY